MKSSGTGLVPLGDTALAISPREGQLITPREPKPGHFVSARAKGFWLKLCSWYGASKMEDFGDWAPTEICKAVDALLHRDDLSAVLVDIKSKHPNWPPNTPQLEAIIRSHIAPAIDWAKLQCDLTEHICKTHWHKMSQPQRIGIPRWQWYNNGAFVPPGDGAGGFFVPYTDIGIVTVQP